MKDLNGLVIRDGDVVSYETGGKKYYRVVRVAEGIVKVFKRSENLQRAIQNATVFGTHLETPGTISRKFTVVYRNGEVLAPAAAIKEKKAPVKHPHRNYTTKRMDITVVDKSNEEIYA